MSRHAAAGRASQAVVISAVAGLSLIAGWASEVGRVALKGHGYAFAGLNDAFYYAAMVFRLWSSPMDVRGELSQVGYELKPGEWDWFYDGGGVHTNYLHAVNGLSHQPPYVYRILVPTVARLFTGVGLSLEAAFLVTYMFGVALLGVFAYRIVCGAFRWDLRSGLVAFGVVVAALATSSPGYPDVTYLGLAVVAVYAALEGRPWVFMILAALAACARETGVALAFVWLAYEWSRGKPKVARLLVALAPVVAFIVVRIAVDVPDSSVDYLGLVSSLGPSRVAVLGLLALLTIGLVSPLIARTVGGSIPGGEDVRRTWRAEVAIWTVGCATAITTMFLATNTSRMALLSLPLFLAPSGWLAAQSRWWLTSAVVAAVGYGAADTLSSRAGAPLGQWPWLITAALALGMQALALADERRRARRTAVTVTYRGRAGERTA